MASIFDGRVFNVQYSIEGQDERLGGQTDPKPDVGVGGMNDLTKSTPDYQGGSK
jgi:hypothetical protein